MKDIILDFLNGVAPDFSGGCPYASKNYALKNVDVNATLAPLLPAVLLPSTIFL